MGSDPQRRELIGYACGTSTSTCVPETSSLQANRVLHPTRAGRVEVVEKARPKERLERGLTELEGAADDVDRPNSLLLASTSRTPSASSTRSTDGKARPLRIASPHRAPRRSSSPQQSPDREQRQPAGEALRAPTAHLSG
jgi:hypothetical protein